MNLRYLALILLLFIALPLHAALPGAEALAGLITGQFDTNSDNLLDQTEWKSGIEQDFQEIDGNADGSLSGAELDALAAPIGQQTGDLAARVVTVLIKQLVLTMDTDKDGAVSLKEYTAQATTISTKLDVNRNGNVEQAELLELPKRLIGA